MFLSLITGCAAAGTCSVDAPAGLVDPCPLVARAQAQDFGQERQVDKEEVRELLERFQQPATGLVPQEGSDVVDLADLLTGGGEEEDEEAIHLLRAFDAVDVLRGDERHQLQYWNAHFILERGDIVRGSRGSLLVIDYPDGTEVRTNGLIEMHVLTAADDPQRRLRIPQLEIALLLQLQETPTTLELPGGNVVSGQNSRVTIRNIDLRILEIRNTGPGSLSVQGPFLGDRVLDLEGGKLVQLPLFPATALPPTGPQHLHRFPDMTTSAARLPLSLAVSCSERVAVSRSGSSLQLEGIGPTEEVVSVHGARLRLEPGMTLHLRRAHLGKPSKEKERN